MRNLIKVFLVFCLIFLVGCNNDSTKVEQLQTEIINLEKQIHELQQHVETKTDDQNTDEESNNHLPEENQPTVVKLVDSNTNTVLMEIFPQQLGYGTDLQKFKKEIETLAKDLARGTETEVGYDQRMELDKMDQNGDVIKGKPMVILKETELVEKILAASESGGEVTLPLYVTESNYQTEELVDLQEVVVASYTTYFNPNDTGRNDNIKLSAQAIDGIIVGVGDYFSFNTVVGPRTEETGYQPALEIINGEFLMGIGGGICQTSSTLFNAVDKLGVRYVERHHHSLSVGYVPEGRDATVSYGALDFRFQNTTGIPFIITTSHTDNSLTIEVRTSQKYADNL